MSPPQASSKQVFLRVRSLDPSFSLPSSPPFNLSPASSMLINSNMRMIPKFSSPYQKVTPRTGQATSELHLYISLPGSTTMVLLKIPKSLRPSSLAPILAINHLITSPRLTLMVRPFPYPTVSSYWALPLIHLLLSTNM